MRCRKKRLTVLLAGLLAAGCTAKNASDSSTDAGSSASDAGTAAADAGSGGSDAGTSVDGGILGRVLPPDPGAAGMATIAGIDSDHDGVRDDVQRFVILSYPSSQRLQSALLQLTVAFQSWTAVPVKDGDLAYMAAEGSNKAISCVYAVATPETAYDAINEVKLQVLNTDARQDAFYATDALLGGAVFTSDPNGSSGATCAFDPQTLPN
jgi:hypothetical protein